MRCACGSARVNVCTAVAYSPHYRGLVFACVNNPSGCFSQDEEEFPTEASALRSLEWYRQEYGLEIKPPGALDPIPMIVAIPVS